MSSLVLAEAPQSSQIEALPALNAYERACFAHAGGSITYVRGPIEQMSAKQQSDLQKIFMTAMHGAFSDLNSEFYEIIYLIMFVSQKNEPLPDTAQISFPTCCDVYSRKACSQGL